MFQSLPPARTPDTAVSNYSFSSSLGVGGLKTINRLVLRNATVRDVLETILPQAGLQLAFIDDLKVPKLLTLNFQQPTSIQAVFDFIVVSAGLRTNVVDRTVFVSASPIPRELSSSQTVHINLRHIKPSEMLVLLQKYELDPLALVADDRSNTLSVSGRHDFIDFIVNLIKDYDRPRPQVRLEVKIIDVVLNNANNLGGGIGNTRVGSASGGLTLNLGLGGGIITQLTQMLQLNLQASIAQGKAKMLASPTMLLMEGQKADINLSQEVFAGYSTSYQTVNGTTVPIQTPIIKNAGLTVIFAVDRINPDSIVMNFSPTVSSIAGTVNTAQGTISLLQQRSLNSGSIRLRNNQELLVSGVIQDSDRHSVTKIPILGDIPLLGILFRSQNKQHDRDELLISIVPHIEVDP